MVVLYTTQETIERCILSLSLRGHLKSCFAVKFNAAVLTDQNR
jgi:hypothetical protein